MTAPRVPIPGGPGGPGVAPGIGTRGVSGALCGWMTACTWRGQVGITCPQDLLRGPWAADREHGGPVAALLAHLLESAAPDGWLTPQLTVDFLNAAPPATAATRRGRPRQPQGSAPASPGVPEPGVAISVVRGNSRTR